MKKRRISAVLSAMVMACSAAASVVPASTNAAEADGKFPKIRKITTNLDENKTDVNKDGEVNYYDARDVETYINDLYEKRGVDYYETDSDGKAIKDEAGALKCNKLSINSSEDSKYDLDKDGFLSPDDYCSLLYMITRQYKYKVSVSNDTATELTAEITGTNLGSYVKELVIPAEIYDITTDRIYPVTKISNSAFYGLGKLESVELNNYVQPNWKDEFGKRIATRGMVTASTPLIVSDYAFWYCTSLKKVVFPENISVKDTSFRYTPFFDENNYDYNGVKVLKGTPKDGKNTTVAYSIDFDTAIDEDGNLTFPSCITAISEKIAENGPSNLKNITFERDYSNNDLYNLKFIGENAFSGCESLVTVNNAFFSYNDEYLKNQMYRYISSFNCTNFMSIETSKQLDKIVNQIKRIPNYDKMNDAEKALVAAKHIVHNVYYNTWYTNPDEFSLYPNSLYSTIDVARGCYESEHAGLNVRFTVCVGISKTYALVLDKLGIKNLTMGLPGHATNQVYISEYTDKNGKTIPGKWYKMDITNYCADRAREIMTAADRDDDLSKLRGYDDNFNIFTCDSDAVKKMTIKKEYINTLNVKSDRNNEIMSDSHEYDASLSTGNFFPLFRDSNIELSEDNIICKHVIGDKEFKYIYNSDNSKLLIYRAGNNDDPEYVKREANKQEALKYYIEAGLVGFIDATDSNYQKIKYVEYELKYDKNIKLYVVKNKNYFDEEHKYHGSDGRIVKDNYFAIDNVSIRDNSSVSKIYFYTGKEGIIELTDNNKKTLFIRIEINNNKIYGYDLATNEKIAGSFSYRGIYSWTFEDGELVDTDCLD